MVMKRLEINIGTYELKKIIDILEESKVTGYTILSDAMGRGRHGKRVKDEITEVNRRSIVICVDTQEKISAVLEKLRPLKKRYSLKAFISDVVVEL